MFEKIEIKNFSTNKKLGVKFGPGVTTIVGKSFKGKSAFIRALKWVCMNVPAGTGFINWAADKAAVRLTVAGIQITRKRSKSINTYKYKSGNKTKVFKAFKNDVPDIVKLRLNVGEINFQGQHDKPFWFAETAGEVSRQLNAIVNLETIDTTLAHLASVIRTDGTTIKVIEQRLAKAVEHKQSLAYVKRLDKDLAKVEQLGDDIVVAEMISDELDEMVDLGIMYQEIIERSRERQRDAQIVVEKCEQYIEAQNKAEELNKVVDELLRLQALASVKVPSTDKAKNLVDQYIESVGKVEDLRSLVSKLIELKELECQAEKQKANHQKELSKLMKGKCPICQRPLKGITL